MTNRIPTLIAAAVLAAPAAAQDLPADPADFADLVAAGSVWASKLFDRGCPSTSEWPGAALAALEDRAETDLATRRSLARAVGRIADCPQADRDRMRDWVVGWVNTVWVDPDAHRWTADFDVDEATESQLDSLQGDNRLILALAPFVAEDRIPALARKIACDARLDDAVRRNANLLLTRDRLEMVWVLPPEWPERPPEGRTMGMGPKRKMVLQGRSRWALLRRRSRMASPKVGSPTTSCQWSTGTWLASSVPRRA